MESRHARTEKNYQFDNKRGFELHAGKPDPQLRWRRAQAGLTSPRPTCSRDTDPRAGAARSTWNAPARSIAHSNPTKTRSSKNAYRRIEGPGRPAIAKARGPGRDGIFRDRTPLMGAARISSHSRSLYGGSITVAIHTARFWHFEDGTFQSTTRRRLIPQKQSGDIKRLGCSAKTLGQSRAGRAGITEKCGRRAWLAGTLPVMVDSNLHDGRWLDGGLSISARGGGT